MTWRDTLRQLSSYVEYPSGTLDSSLISWTVSQVTTSGNLLKPGEFCRNKIEIKYRGSLNLSGQKVSVYLKNIEPFFPSDVLFPSDILYPKGGEVGYQLGVFWLENPETNDGGQTYTVTGYSVPSGGTETATIQTGKVADIVAAAEDAMGISFVDGTTWELEDISAIGIPEGSTWMQLLAYFAGYEGKNIRCTNDGKLEKFWYTSKDFTISRDIQFQGELLNSEVTTVINAVRITSGENQIDAGSGFPVIFENPYITTQEQAQHVLDNIGGYQYVVGSVKWRGNPLVNCGDSVQAELTEGTYANFPIMENKISFDGGMNYSSESYDYRQSNQNVSNTSPTMNKITQQIGGLKQTFEDVSNNITGAKDGNYSLIFNEAGAPIAWQITDVETAGAETPVTAKGWRFSYGGLGWSEDGFQSYKNIALDMNGHLVLNELTTGILTDGSGLNYWNLETGEIKISLLSQLQQEVDGIDNSRTNLLVGTQDYTGWETSGDVTFSMSPNVDGFKEATIINTESGRQSILTGKWAGTLLAGQKYTLSFVSSSQTPYDIRVYAKASDVTVTEGEYTIASQSFYVRFPADSTEKKRSFTFTVSEDKESNYVEVSVPTEYTSQGVTIYAFKLEKGDTATEWTPSYNEGYVVKAEIIASINNDYQSEIKIKADKISLEGIVTANGNIQITEDGSIVAKNGTFTGSEFTFGTSYPITMKSNSNGDGISIEGQGKLYFKSNHNFEIYNTDTNGYNANIIKVSSQDLVGGKTSNSVSITNYYSGTTTKSSYITSYSSDSYSNVYLGCSAYRSSSVSDPLISVSFDRNENISTINLFAGSNTSVLITDQSNLPGISLSSKDSVQITQKHGSNFLTGNVVQGGNTSHNYALQWNGSSLHFYVDNIDVGHL